jgi:3-phenylpropionate/trans-cinnamate dioxygenase ferredoxin subunit
MEEQKKVCQLSELKESVPTPFTIEGEDILLIRTDDTVHAVADNCTHQDFPLAHGKVVDTKIKCKAHGAEFCLKTGKALSPPAFAPLRTYHVTITEGAVFVEIT